MFDDVERVAATLAGLCLFALNDLRLLGDAAREAAPGLHRALILAGGGSDAVFLTALEAASRWGLAGLTLALALWAAAETWGRPPADKA